MGPPAIRNPLRGPLTATSFLRHLPLQLLMKSIGDASGGGCGSSVVVFAHRRVDVQHRGGSSLYRQGVAASLRFTLPQGFRAKEES